jgi:F-type H+-transporting ATPase subunit a
VGAGPGAGRDGRPHAAWRRGFCVTVFAFILCCNWLAALPTEHWIPPPTADVNLVYPLALLVIVWVNVAGIRAKGAKAYFGHFTQPYAFLAPIEFITQYVARPASLALRLFGNIFAGGIMIAVIALMPAYICGCPTRSGSSSTCSSGSSRR